MKRASPHEEPARRSLFFRSSVDGGADQMILKQTSGTSQALQEREQVIQIQSWQSLQSMVVSCEDIFQFGGRAIVKVRTALGQAAQRGRTKWLALDGVLRPKADRLG